MGQNKMYKGTIMNHAQEQRRKQAVVRYLAGDKIEAICRDLHCSKSWLYTWKARYQTDDPTWAKGLSTQPRHKPSQVPQRIEQRVVELRRTLGQRGQHGSAASIQQELEQQGIKPIPSLRTIYRMLQRHNQEDI
jgi:transposase